jgi:16S rRNA (cytosine967-C5)-methyltransferase
MSQAPSQPETHYSSDLSGQAGQGQSSPPSQSEMLQARRVALHVLQQVFGHRHTLDQALDESKGFAALSQRDRAFVRMLVTTVIRRLGQIDDLIRRALSRPDQPLNPPILEYVLRLGVAQIVFMNIPDHAAVNTSVMLVEAEGHGRIKGFVNAIMRRVASEGKDWTTRQDVARLNTPEWLLKIWIEDFGLKNAIDIATANLHEAPLDISLKRAVTAEQMAEALDAQILPTGSLRIQGSRMVTELPGFDDGMWWVQDAAAAIPVKLFGDRIEGHTVIDLCAAPGGKTAQLASLGANVIAVDRSAKRLQRLQDNMKRLNLSDRVKTDVADAAVWRTREPVPFILLDAPCSATGTVRRNPDVIWMKTPADIHSLVELQARLLESAVSMLASGGTLIYCTCSLQKEEGEHQIERILETHPELSREAVHIHELGGISEIITPRGDIRILPSHLSAIGGMDGFFISRLRKN